MPADVPADPGGAHCSSCGRPSADCAGCGRELDPPRFCTTCGRGLRVAVSPAGFTATCKTHGPI